MEFNPYTEWLAIPPAQTPPSHYRLLGVRDFEPNAEKIHAAALAQIARLRLYQTSEHADASQRLMNEVSQARIVLADPAKRAEYDRRLQGFRPPEKSKPAFEPPPLPQASPLPSLPAFTEDPIADAEFDSSDDDNNTGDWIPEPSTSRFSRLGAQSPLQLAIRASLGTIVLLTLGVVVLLFLRKSQSPSSPSNDPIQEIVNVPTPPVKEKPDEPPSAPVDPPMPPVVESTVIVAKETPSPPPVRRPVEEGKVVLWSWTGDEDVPVGAMVPVGERWDRDNQGTKLSLKATGQQRVYWPAALGPNQISMHFIGIELNDPYQSLALGGVDERNAFAGLSIGLLADKIVVSTQAGPASHGNTLTLPSAANFWAIVQFHDSGQWSAVIKDENGTEHARHDFKSEICPRLWKCELSSKAPMPSIARMSEVSIEGVSGTSTPLWYLWPKTIYWPSVDTILTELGGTYQSAGPANFTARFSFDSPEERARWLSTKEKEGTATPPIGKTIPLGPVINVEWILARMRFVERTTTFRIDFTDGPSLLVEGTTGKVKLNDAVLTEFDPLPEFFDLSIPLTQPVPNVTPSPQTKAPSTPIPTGQASLTLLQGEIEIEDFQYEGDLNFMPLWIKSLRPRPKTNITGSYEYLDTKPGYIYPFQVKRDDIVRVESACTPGDDTFPYLSPDALDLFFVSKTEQGSHFHCTRRTDPGELFDVVTKLVTPNDNVEIYSGSLTPDGLTSVFALRVAPDRTVIDTMERAALDMPFKAPAKRCVTGLSAADATPQLSPDGLRLLYSRQKQDSYELVEIVRTDFNRPFVESNAQITPFGRFRHPSIAPDNRTLYLNGPSENGQNAIFVATRPSVSDKWSSPRLIDRLQSSSTKRGNVTPRVSSDGRLLFFASDREGSIGGFDIWVTAVAELNAPADAPTPMVEPEVIGDWLVLGPLPPPVGQENSLDEIKRTMQRRDRASTPRVGDEAHGIQWRRANKIAGGRGVYLVMFPFELEKSSQVRVEIRAVPGAAVFWLANDEAASATGIDPWSTPETLPTTGNTVTLRKGLNRLAGVICATGDAEIRVRLLEGETENQLSGINEAFR